MANEIKRRYREKMTTNDIWLMWLLSNMDGIPYTEPLFPIKNINNDTMYSMLQPTVCDSVIVAYYILTNRSGYTIPKRRVNDSSKY